ncbi:MAG: DNA methyltransferase [Chloroflexota bacterium]
MVGQDLTNTLYYGDNLEILTRFISDESVDLVYLDPPFNKNAAYSIIFRDESGRTSDAQMATLEDYWHWGPTPAQHYEYLTNSAEHGGVVPHAVSDLVGALHSAIRPSPLLAYLVEMAVRLVELRRVLKPTGSLYLHCDPTNSHYLKLLLDAIFGPRNFFNEIVWKRTATKGDARRKYGAVHDVILVYGRGPHTIFNSQGVAHGEGYTSRFTLNDNDGRGPYEGAPLDSPNPRPNLTYEYKGYAPPRNGWRVSRGVMEQLDADHRLIFPAKHRGRIRRKNYLWGLKGRPIGDVWTDLPPINSQARERLGFPTQKPLALLERIITASSQPGGVVLDPFCGCGTALQAASGLGRNWIGIDISNLAVQVIQDRMGTSVPVFDWPTEMDGVKRMIEGPDGRHRFEVWALARLGLAENRRGGDGGIDGRIAFTGPGGRLENIVVSVKSGHVGPAAVRDLKGTMGRERSAMGLLFTFEEPTSSATREAVESGFYRSPLDGRQYPKVVIHTVRDLLEDGRLPDLPTQQGIQASIWPLPASTRAVRLRVIKRTPERKGPRLVPDRSRPAVERYARESATASGPEAQRSLRKSTRDRLAPLPSRGSADTD